LKIILEDEQGENRVEDAEPATPAFRRGHHDARIRNKYNSGVEDLQRGK